VDGGRRWTNRGSVAVVAGGLSKWVAVGGVEEGRKEGKAVSFLGAKIFWENLAAAISCLTGFENFENFEFFFLIKKRSDVACHVRRRWTWEGR
jgi:hypothetical protein